VADRSVQLEADPVLNGGTAIAFRPTQAFLCQKAAIALQHNGYVYDM
jgi:hypothetical protein